MHIPQFSPYQPYQVFWMYFEQCLEWMTSVHFEL